MPPDLYSLGIFEIGSYYFSLQVSLDHDPTTLCFLP
jgi:hypothetical protein